METTTLVTIFISSLLESFIIGYTLYIAFVQPSQQLTYPFEKQGN
ncbi:PsbN protein [Dioscorea alata]|uniref:PsbN protein n=1 Tax=Dioscorea alata TaxID=55571 RepID=A0ACB7UVJ5_DIOAL|nr:PsbN protein [Dioscorea alata]